MNAPADLVPPLPVLIVIILTEHALLVDGAYIYELAPEPRIALLPIANEQAILFAVRQSLVKRAIGAFVSRFEPRPVLKPILNGVLPILALGRSVLTSVSGIATPLTLLPLREAEGLQSHLRPVRLSTEGLRGSALTFDALHARTRTVLTFRALTQSWLTFKAPSGIVILQIQLHEPPQFLLKKLI